MRVVAALFLFSVASVTGSTATNADTFLDNGVTAHRGNSGEFPENTILAFASGIRLGVDWLELDIFKTKDGKLVVIHDRTTKRVSDKALDVAGSTYDELLTVDVTAEFRRKHNLTLEQCPKQTAPLLEDVLRLMMSQKQTRVSIQPKVDCVGEAVALVKQLKCEAWVGFNDGNLALMAKVKKLAPELPVFWDRGDTNIDQDIAIAKQHAFEALVLNEKAVTKEKIEKIHSAGLEAGAWTVNDEAAMKRLLTLDIDRIYTDYPERLLVIRQRAASEWGTTDWPQWRGPAANGVADGRDLPVHWSTRENIVWSAKLPGWGTSSPVVYRDRVFVTSEVDENDNKSLLTLCFDRTTGRELWRHEFGLGVVQRTHEKSNLAVNTPAVSPDSLYVAFGNADVARYSHDGDLAWVTRYLETFDDPKMAWGYCLSPVVLKHSVLFPWDHHTGPCFLIGLDKQTGKFAWKKKRPIGTAHATPLVVDHRGKRIILVPGKNRLTAFDAKTHEELWQYGEGSGEYNGEIIVSPVYGDSTVFLQLWRQSRIHAIRMNDGGEPPTRLWVSARPSGAVTALLPGSALCLDGQWRLGML